jgi:hypothetical protein
VLEQVVLQRVPPTCQLNVQNIARKSIERSKHRSQINWTFKTSLANQLNVQNIARKSIGRSKHRSQINWTFKTSLANQLDDVRPVTWVGLGYWNELLWYTSFSF